MAINPDLLKERTLDIKDLLLDPNNPRFSKHHNEIIPFEKVADLAVQKVAYEQMLSRANHFEIEELVAAIRADGFIHVDKIFVQKVKEKYLIIEGNRRISAIKKILDDESEEITPELKKQITQIPCIVIDTSEPGAEELMRKILGLRHHGSILPWKPLPAAFNLYREYMLAHCSGDAAMAIDPENFQYVPATAKRVAAMYSVKLSDVREKVRLYRVYLQLIDASNNARNVISPDSFSMIEETLNKQALKTFFGYDESLSTFSEEGTERVLDLYFGLNGKEPVITEASAGMSNVRDFAFVVSEGTPEDIRRIMEDREKAGDVKTTVAAKILKHTLQHALEIVLNELNKINIGEMGTFAPNEKEYIANIDKKMKLLKRAVGLKD